LLSGIVGIFISAAYYRRYENRRLKLDLIRRLAGTRHQVAAIGDEMSYDAFFTPLNEVFVVFHDEPKVIAALDTFKRELHIPVRQEENLPRLFRALFASMGLRQEWLNDQFIMMPFTPGPVLPPQRQ
jgi:hypothetical protein